MRLLSDSLAVGPLIADERIANKWQPLAEHDLLIFVGLTGVGKTTTLESLSALGFTFALLPNRRTLTDELLITELQLADGVPVAAVHDREQRFAYTRRYRELYTGGMAHALAQLLVNQGTAQAISSSRKVPHRARHENKREFLGETIPYLFDGLRGVNEVTYAAQQMPNTRFIVLTASDFVRVQRLLKRNDAFDQVDARTQHAPSDNLLGEAASLFTLQEQRELQGWVEAGEIDAAEMQAKLKIVSTERQNYDSVASIEALQAIAPERTLVVDTVTYSPQQIAEQIMAF